MLPRSLGTIDTTTGPKLQVDYVIGVSGGADLSADGGSLVLAEFGARINRYEGLVRAGEAGGNTAVDFTFRWSLLETAVSPMIGVAYAYANNGFGYGANAGLRWDLVRGGQVGFSLVADLGLRWTTGTDSSGASTSGVGYPLELSAEVTYRLARR